MQVTPQNGEQLYEQYYSTSRDACATGCHPTANRQNLRRCTEVSSLVREGNYTTMLRTPDSHTHPGMER